MYLSFKTIKRFFADKSGAVTVDYVVLTAVAAGVALAASDLVLEGYAALAANVNGELSGEEVANVVDTSGTITYTSAFSNGATGWDGASATEVDGIGNVLGPIGGTSGQQGVSMDFDMMSGLESSTINFDFYALDSLDRGEEGLIFIDGQAVASVTKSDGAAIFTSLDVDGVTVKYEMIDDNVQLGGNMGSESWWTDSLMNVTITVDAPSDSLQVGFGSTTNQDASDESFAVDNFTIDGVLNPDYVDTSSGV